MYRRIPYLIPILLPLLLLPGCSGDANYLEKVQKRGKLIAITRNAATTYYEGPFGPMGLEHDLLSGFAEYIGVELELIVAPTVSEVLEQLAEGEVDLAAAGLTATEPRKLWARFSPPYQMITQQLVYRTGTPKPDNLGELDGHLEIIANSSHEEQLGELHIEYRDLSWTKNSEVESEELLTMVWNRVIDYTIADSNEVAMNQRFYPELRVAFDITEPQPLAWAFPKFRDGSLHQAASDYFAEIEGNATLGKLLDRYYGHLEKFDYVGTRTYIDHIEQRLPEFRPMFEYAAEEFGIDWELIAAAAYQESHWNPDAVSPTGVRGIMMLTNRTAEEIGVQDRTDPVESIRGGTYYLTQMLNKIPERIQSPDRLWMALASYNIGFGHLEDARIITSKLGGDPDVWKDVRDHLPLLRKRKWYRKTRHGYARGNEAVTYVENIRSYYDILSWYVEQNTPKLPAQPRALGIDNPAL